VTVVGQRLRLDQPDDDACSEHSRCGEASAMRSTKPGWRSYTGETLMLTYRGLPSGAYGSAAASAIALLITQSPRGTINPVCSAESMISLTGTGPHPRGVHRNKASYPTVVPQRRSTIG
jgi:hypothetical protein